MNPVSRRDVLGAAGGIAVSFSFPSIASAQSGITSGELAFSSAADLARLIQQKKISSLELTQHYIERIERFDEALNAVVVRDFERALDAARLSDESLARGNRLGSLHGVPMTIKEAFDVSGLPTTWGVPAQRNNIVRDDATAAEQLKGRWRSFPGESKRPAEPRGLAELQRHLRNHQQSLEYGKVAGRILRRFGRCVGGGSDGLGAWLRYRRVDPEPISLLWRVRTQAHLRNRSDPWSQSLRRCICAGSKCRRADGAKCGRLGAGPRRRRES
jgi:hypothetical protein